MKFPALTRFAGRRTLSVYYILLAAAGSAALGFLPKKTMEIAQSLFAAGLIIDMRTNNPNLSEEAIDTG